MIISSVHYLRIIRITLVLIFIQVSFSHFLSAQNTEQLWLEYRPTYTFSKSFKVNMRASWRTNFVQPRWRTAELRIMPVITLSKHIDILSSVQFLETLQYQEFTSSEIRFAAGGQWHILPGRRISSGIRALVEFRNVYKKEAEDWTYTTRPRLRIFASMPINEKSMSGDKVFYATTFVEFFYQDDEDLQERYSNRLWIRVGLGYKLNSHFKFEILYNRQDAKNTINTSFEDLTAENIFLLTVRHKLNKPKK